MVGDKNQPAEQSNGKVLRAIFGETEKLQEKKSKEALIRVQKKNDLWRYQNERDEAREG